MVTTFKTAARRPSTTSSRCSGLLPREALFEPEQLAEMHRALTFVCEQDEDLSIGRKKEIKTIMEQIKCLLPESPEQTQTMEQSM